MKDQSEDYYNLIDKIIRREASSSEKNQFEELMKKDDAFRKEYELRASVKSAFLEEERERMRSEINSWESELNKRGQSMYWYRIAAGILIFSVAAIALVFSERSSSGEQLFDEYYKTYPNLLTTGMRGTSDDKESLSEVLSFYDQREYAIFLQAIDTIQDEKIDLYAAVAHIELNQIELAKNILNNIRAKDAVNAEESTWYLALIALREKDENKAKQLLKSISGAPTPLGKKAAELLGRL